MKCQFAGAGVMLLIWVVVFAITAAFEKQLGEYGGFINLAALIVGAWFGYETMQQCRAKSQPPSPSS